MHASSESGNLSSVCVRRDTPYILLWALTPLVTSIASKYTSYPNQIFVLYELIVVFVGIVTLKQFIRIVVVQARWLALLLLYCLVFIGVSYYGVDFATSLRYGILYQPLILFEFFIAFSIGYAYREEQVFRYLSVAAFLLMGYTLLDIALSPGQERFVTTLNIPMGIPIFVFSGHTLSAFVAIIILLLSLKKTIVAVGLLSFIMAITLKRYVTPRAGRFKAIWSRKRLISGVITTTILLVGMGAILSMYSSYILGSVGRFSEGEDTSRSGIAIYSLLLLAEHFPRGIGWFGFSYLSAGVISYEVTTARGDVLSGANLHNSFMTWALEGGLPILLIMLVFFWKLSKVIWFFFRSSDKRVLGATLLIWFASGIVFGAFQQWHSSGTFWGLFGLAFGCLARYRARL